MNRQTVTCCIYCYNNRNIPENLKEGFIGLTKSNKLKKAPRKDARQDSHIEPSGANHCQASLDMSFFILFIILYF